MTAVERTAYPRFKRRPSAQELADVYAPTTDELTFLRATARGAAPTLTLAVLLKTFARLGHFPRLQDVPFAVVAHVRSCLRLPPGTALDVTPRTLYKHHAAIRAFLRVQPRGPAARHAAVVAMHEAAQVKEHPADLINVAIGALRALAGRLGCPVLGIAERNRASMTSGGLNAAAGSRKFEYTGESVLDLGVDEKGGPLPGPGETAVVLHVAKNRNGAAGKRLHLAFHGALQRFADLER
jgi:hypothetical protein